MRFPNHPYDIPLQFREYMQSDQTFTETMALAFFIMALYYGVNNKIIK